MSSVGGINVNVKAAGRARVSVSFNVPGDVPPRPERLKFGKGNGKLPKHVRIFSLPAGHTCPYARECFSRADRQTGRITDGPHTEFRCFAATAEGRPNVRAARWYNWDLLQQCRTADEMAELILASLPEDTPIVRIHDSGDFFNQRYFDAWLLVAKRRPQTLFYAYTKALPFWIRRLEQVGDGHRPGTVPNFVLTASRGGMRDELIDQHSLRSAVVLIAGSRQEADRMAAERGLEVDHDDTHAQRHGLDFALLVHGAQPAGTPAAKAIAAQRANGEFGYGKRADEIRREAGRLPLRLCR